MNAAVAVLPAPPLAFYSLTTPREARGRRLHRPRPSHLRVFDALAGGLADNPAPLDRGDLPVKKKLKTNPSFSTELNMRRVEGELSLTEGGALSGDKTLSKLMSEEFFVHRYGDNAAIDDGYNRGRVPDAVTMFVFGARQPIYAAALIRLGAPDKAAPHLARVFE
jgi:hypothetical protein